MILPILKEKSMSLCSAPDMEDRVMPLSRACIPLRSTQLETLRRLSKDSGAPVAELIRRAIDAYLATRLAGSVPGRDIPETCQEGSVPAS